MRGSLLAVLAIAVIAGLGSVVAVRNLGLLNPPATPTTIVEQKAQTVAVAATPSVLVPSRHLFEGDTINPQDVRLRAMNADELQMFNEKKLIPIQIPDVAFFRAPSKDLVADQPILPADLAEPKKPEALHTRLLPGTRAVDISVMKEQSAGGNIQVGDWVDVYLNVDVSRTDRPSAVPYTGVLLQRAPVIAKRQTLYQIYAPLPPGEAIPYTIAANPYRAALIEYSRSLGTISLVPVSLSEKKELDKFRDEGKLSSDPKYGIPFAQPDSTEFVAEMERIQKYSRGESSVGSDDLMRVLNLPELPKAPTAEQIQKAKPINIEVISGVRKTGTTTFVPPPLPPQAFYVFSNPKAKTESAAGAGAGGPAKGQLVPPVRN